MTLHIMDGRVTFPLIHFRARTCLIAGHSISTRLESSTIMSFSAGLAEWCGDKTLERTILAKTPAQLYRFV